MTTPQTRLPGASIPQFTMPLTTLSGNRANGTVTMSASGGPGYVWHCHILDHEDNEMMRPILIAK